MTAAFVACLAGLQTAEGARKTATLGALTAVVMVAGTGEGLTLALGTDGAGFGMATLGGFIGLTLWLIATGIGLIRRI